MLNLYILVYLLGLSCPPLYIYVLLYLVIFTWALFSFIEIHSEVYLESTNVLVEVAGQHHAKGVPKDPTC